MHDRGERWHRELTPTLQHSVREPASDARPALSTSSFSVAQRSSSQSGSLRESRTRSVQTCAVGENV
jgi:hypothetical protein